MPKFSYNAIAQDGKEKTGSIEAMDIAAATKTLKNEGLVPFNVSKQGILSADIDIGIKKSIKPRDLSVFCRQMTSLLNSGITLVKALDMLGNQTENKMFKEAIDDARVMVEKGESLTIAMSGKIKIFPSILVNMVAAGEMSGTLDITFERMAIHFEKSAKLKALVKKAMIYPVMLSIVAVLVIAVMSIVVVPQFVTLFDSMGAELPFITQIVMNMSNFFRHQWYILLGLGIIVTLLVKNSKKTSRGRLFWGTLMVRTPIFGPLAVKNICASFSRTMSTLIGTGVSLSESLEIAARSIDNEVFKKAIEQSRTEVEKGSVLSELLEGTGIFPPMVYQMLGIGEETGNIEKMLTKVAEYYEDEVEMTTGTLNAAMEPVIIVVMGVIIGFIAMALYMPMIDMYSNMGNL